MPRRTRGLLVIGVRVLDELMRCSLTLIAGWTTAKIIHWVQDLPNRITVDVDAAAKLFGSVIIESHHHALANGDSTLQLQIIREQFFPMIDESPEAAIWIWNEYQKDLLALAVSGDSEVSAAASDLVMQLEMVLDSPQP